MRFFAEIFEVSARDKNFVPIPQDYSRPQFWLADFQAKVDGWAEAHNPLFAGPHANVLSLLPFAGLAILLWATGRELVFRRRV